MKISTIALTGCAGCHVALVSLNEKLLELLRDVEIVHSYILMDEKKIPESDIILVEGSVRTQHNVEWLEEARRKARILVAFGSCACFGGLQGLLNPITVESLLKYVYTQTPGTEAENPPTEVPKALNHVKPISEIVKVDYMIPGCPPQENDIIQTLTALIKGEEPPEINYNVCQDCRRNKMQKPPEKIVYPHEIVPDPEKCLLEQGILCLGPFTRGGCQNNCPSNGAPCLGCRGPAAKIDDQTLALLDALAAVMPPEKIKEHLAMLTTLNPFSYAYSKIWKTIQGVKK